MIFLTPQKRNNQSTDFKNDFKNLINKIRDQLFMQRMFWLAEKA